MKKNSPPYLAAKLRRVVRIPRMMLWAFVMEGKETTHMLHTFARKGKARLLISNAENGPSEEEMRRAVEQLKDLPRFLPFFVFIVVPAPGITEGYVLLAVTLEKWLGLKVSLLPTHFRNIFKKEKDDEINQQPDLPNNFTD